MPLRTEARMGESVVHGYAEMAGHHLTHTPPPAVPQVHPPQSCGKRQNQAGSSLAQRGIGEGASS